MNWLNYKTGIRGIYFRMDADTEKASICIEIVHDDAEQWDKHFSAFLQYKQLLHQFLNEDWNWQRLAMDEHNKSLSRIYKELKGVNVLDTSCWPAIIFLKPRIVALDEFWVVVKENFQQL